MLRIVFESGTAAALCRVKKPVRIPQNMRIHFIGSGAAVERKSRFFFAENPLVNCLNIDSEAKARAQTPRMEFTDSLSEIVMSDVHDPSALVRELTALRQRVAQLEAAAAERRQADAELQHEHAWLTSLLATTQDAFLSIDRQGRISHFNPAAERTFGYTAAEVHGQDLRLLMPQPYAGEHAGYITRYERTGEARAIGRIRSVSAKRKNGEVFPIELSVTEIAFDEDVHYGAFIRDVSERVELQERLLEHERYASLMKRAHAEGLEAKYAAEAANRAKSEFLATMSHELRTPLQIILGYTELLREEAFGPLTPEQTAPLSSVDRSARELLDLITAMLDLSRLEAGRLPLTVSCVDAVQVLAEVWRETQLLQEQSPLTFVWQVDEPRLVVQTDPQYLKVILKNLLDNAIKYTEAGRITLTAQGHAESVEIQIVDTGIGIPPEALSQIFEPFSQVDHSDRRKYGGVGLGLHIVRRFIERLGGRVNVESEVGRGTTFRVRIPLSPSSIL